MKFSWLSFSVFVLVALCISFVFSDDVSAQAGPVTLPHDHTSLAKGGVGRTVTITPQWQGYVTTPVPDLVYSLTRLGNVCTITRLSGSRTGYSSNANTFSWVAGTIPEWCRPGAESTYRISSTPITFNIGGALALGNASILDTGRVLFSLFRIDGDYLSTSSNVWPSTGTKYINDDSFSWVIGEI